jgi:hypothetical protein
MGAIRPIFRNVLASFFPILALLAATGCASSYLSISKPLSRDANLSSYNCVAVEIKPVPRGWKEIADEIEVGLLQKLKRSGAFPEVESYAKSMNYGDRLILRVSLEEVNEVSGGQRFMMGAFAGRAEVAADLELVDERTAAVLSRAEVQAETGSHSIMAGTTHQAVDKVVDEIVAFIREHK